MIGKMVTSHSPSNKYNQSEGGLINTWIFGVKYLLTTISEILVFFLIVLVPILKLMDYHRNFCNHGSFLSE